MPGTDRGYQWSVRRTSWTDALGRSMQARAVKMARAAAAGYKIEAKEVAHSAQLSSHRSIYDPGNGQRVDKWGQRELKRRHVTAGHRHYINSFTSLVRVRKDGATVYFGNSSPIAAAIEGGVPPHDITPGKTGGSHRAKTNKAGKAGQFTAKFLVFPRANFAKDAKPYIRLRKVKHPGQQAEHIVRDAVDKTIDKYLR